MLILGANLAIILKISLSLLRKLNVFITDKAKVLPSGSPDICPTLWGQIQQIVAVHVIEVVP